MSLVIFCGKMVLRSLKILRLNRLDSVSMANGFHVLEDNNFINNSMVNDNHNRICNNKSNETKATVKSFYRR